MMPVKARDWPAKNSVSRCTFTFTRGSAVSASLKRWKLPAETSFTLIDWKVLPRR